MLCSPFLPAFGRVSIAKLCMGLVIVISIEIRCESTKHDKIEGTQESNCFNEELDDGGRVLGPLKSKEQLGVRTASDA
jgi:hypothetical protein